MASPIKTHMNKYAFKIGGDDMLGDDGNMGDMHDHNARLHVTLNACKDQISRYYHNRKWDVYKRFTNEHELVFTTSPNYPGIAAYVPISRSFFKLWEIMHDHVAELGCDTKGTMRAAFLAEGPGGFMESFAKFRADRGLGPDELHGMTLMSKANRAVPRWKMDKLPNGSVVIHGGADGSGNLLDVRNVAHLVNEVGPGTCEFITADGGFDFSNDFNNQEAASIRLVACEVYAALSLQRPGGSFVLKVYDMKAPSTLHVVALLHHVYRAVRIVKPWTSRPANSEKYLVCTGFMAASEDVKSALHIACEDPTVDIDAALRNVAPITPAFFRCILDFNTYYIARQIYYITRTILLIKRTGIPDVHTQLLHCLRWCQKYKIPSSPASLQKYASSAHHKPSLAVCKDARTGSM